MNSTYQMKGNKVMTNTHKQFPKYITIVSHHLTVSSSRLTSGDKLWSYIALRNSDKQMAIAEGVCRGFRDDETFSIHIAKKIRKQDGKATYKSIMRVFFDGEVNDTSAESFNEWQVTIDDIDFE